MATLEEGSGQQERTEVPAGTYNANITNCAWKVSTEGNEYVSVEFTLTSGHIDRRVWTNLNFKHPKENVQEMARRSASNICHAIGLHSLEEPEELLGNSLTIKVGPQKNDPERTEVKRYMKLETAIGSAPTPAAAGNGAALVVEEDEPVW
jgi:hypothetical protein